MSFINWGHETPEQKAVRKRMEENMMNQLMAKKMFEARGATSASASASAGSGAQANGSAKVSFAPVIYHMGTLANGNVGIIVANTITGEYSQLLDLGEYTNETNSGYGTSNAIIHNGCALFTGYSPTTTKFWLAFVDVAGNLIQFIKSSNYIHYSGNDGTSISAWHEASDTSTKFYWWTGDKIFSKTISNTPDGINQGLFNWITSADGTINLYARINSELSGAWLARPDGTLVDIFDTLFLDGVLYWTNRMHTTGDFIGLFFKDPEGVAYYKLRILQLDGTYTDYEIDTVTEAPLYLTSFAYGNNNLGFMVSSDTFRTVYAYNNDTKALVASDLISRAAYSQYTYDYNRLDPTWDYFNSMNGFNNMMFHFYTYNDYDGKMSRYDDYMILTFFPDTDHFEQWIAVIGGVGETFGIGSWNIQNTHPQFIINPSESDGKARILTIKPGGSYSTAIMDYVDFTWADLLSCGNVNVLVTHDAFRIIDSDNGSIITSRTGLTANDYSANWNTFYLTDTNSGQLHYWHPSSGGSIQTPGLTIQDMYYWDEDYRSAQWHQIGGHSAGITYFQNGWIGRILSPSGMSNYFDIPEYMSVYVSANFVIFVYKDGTWMIDVYATDGTKLSTIDTDVPQNSSVSYNLVSDRFFLWYSGASKFFTIKPDGTVSASETLSTISQWYGSIPNDYNHWDWC